LRLTGVAAFIDCDSSSLPWDMISGFFLEPGKSHELDIPLATNFEAAVGVNACG